MMYTGLSKINNKGIILMEAIAEHEDISAQTRMYLNKFDREIKEILKLIEIIKRRCRNQSKIDSTKLTPDQQLYISNLMQHELNSNIIPRVKKLEAEISAAIEELKEKSIIVNFNLLFTRFAILLTFSLLPYIFGVSGVLSMIFGGLSYFLSNTIIVVSADFMKKISGRYIHISSGIIDNIFLLFTHVNQAGNLRKLEKEVSKIYDLIETIQKEQSKIKLSNVSIQSIKSNFVNNAETKFNKLPLDNIEKFNNKSYELELLSKNINFNIEVIQDTITEHITNKELDNNNKVNLKKLDSNIVII